jgi:hypothetical protein
MRQLNFREAAKIIRAVDADLEESLRVVWDQAGKDRQGELCFFLARYPYKSFVFKDGKALDPNGEPLRSDLLVANNLPVGLILDKVLEVIDEVIRKGRVIEFPQSLLFKKELIGLWELIDDQLKVEGRPPSNWTISSGSRNLKFLEFPAQKVQWDRLRARYRHLSTHDREDIRGLKEVDLVGRINELDEKCRQWATPVLYFAPSWFEELRSQSADQERALLAMRLFSYFQTRGWSTLARVRYNDDQLTDALTEWGGNHNAPRYAPRCKAAYLLLRYSFQVLSQRRPCFGLADGNRLLGPLDVLKEELLQVARLHETILGPTYLHPGQVGFLSLSQLVPSAFEQDPADSLEYIFQIISRARESAARLHLAIPGLDKLPELFSRLTFRVRTGRERQRGRHGSVMTFKVHWAPSPGGTYEKKMIPFEAFYEPVFTGGTVPPPDSRFFRVAVKLDLRESVDIPEY